PAAKRRLFVRGNQIALPTHHRLRYNQNALVIGGSAIIRGIIVRQPVYPFTAIVGQQRMKPALTLHAVNPSTGAVRLRGERGTAKSTAARALAALLPDIEVVADCRFNCDPRHPDWLCTECRERLDRGEQLPVKTRRTRLVDLPVSATEDRVVGTLDI